VCITPWYPIFEMWVLVISSQSPKRHVRFYPYASIYLSTMLFFLDEKEINYPKSHFNPFISIIFCEAQQKISVISKEPSICITFDTPIFETSVFITPHKVPQGTSGFTHSLYYIYKPLYFSWTRKKVTICYE